MNTTTPTIDLVSLLEQNTGFRSTGNANNNLHGTEYWGPCCPFCGTGTDRFHVYPFSSNPKPHFWCRACGKTGDHIDVLTTFKNLSFVEACQELGIEPGDSIQHAAPLWFDDDPPPKGWQEFGRLLVERAVTHLWEKGHDALAYLLKRGLTEETIKRAQLGYIPLGKDGKWFERPFSDWGLTEDMLTDKQKEKGGVKIPPGILIPWFADGQLWKLAVKRFEAGSGEMKYGQVVGSKDALYGIDSLARGKPVLLCEGEFDVLSAVQEASDLIVPIGTGSTAKGRTPLWIAKLASQASCTLVGFDNDSDNQAGDKASDDWLDILPNSLRWPPLAHDINDMLQQQKPIRKWVARGLELATMAPVQEEAPTVPPETFEDWLDSLDADPVEPEDWCCLCDGDVEFYSADGKAYCARCWEKQQPEPVATWLICSGCGNKVLTYHHDQICHWCYFGSLPAVQREKPEMFSFQKA